MSDRGLRHAAKWPSQAIQAAAAMGETAQRMEHRWGLRRPCRAKVRISAGSGIAGTGQLRNVSMSGALLETTLPLSLFSQIGIAVLRDDGSRRSTEFTATVIRIGPGNFGLEWCQTAPGSVCRMLGCARECSAGGS